MARNWYWQKLQFSAGTPLRFRGFSYRAPRGLMMTLFAHPKRKMGLMGTVMRLSIPSGSHMKEQQQGR